MGKTTITVASTGRSYTSDAPGHFKIRVPAGTYDLKLSRFGYHDQQVRAVVAGGKLTELRVALKPTPRGTISGRVTYGPTGSTVPGATVRVLDVLDELTAVSDGNGRYTVQNVPEGTYRVAASVAGVSTTTPRQVVVTGRHRPATADFALPRPPATQRASVTRDGGQIRAHTFWPAMSGDGGVIAFASTSAELAPGDTNDDMDIFARDGRTGAIERITAAPDGSGANAWSVSPSISPDGRYVGFLSGATNLVPGDRNGIPDSFTRDRRTGATELISVSSNEKQADGLSGQPVFSTDGRYAVFLSQATNLAPGDTNGKQDIFLRDRVAGTTELVSAGRGGAPADGDSLEPSVSGDGRFVAFESGAENLVPGGGNAHRDVFVRDRKTGTTELIPAPGGAEATQPSISADGRKVAYVVSPADAPSQIYVHDRQAHTNTLVTKAASGTGGADSYSASPRISGDGTAIAFFSFAGNLVPGDDGGASDVFVRDLRTAKTDKVSGVLGGQVGDAYSDFPSISTEGKYVAFESEATNLVEDDTNRNSDIFVRDRAPGPAPRFALADLRAEDGHGWWPVRVTASVKDIGELAGDYQAVLWIDGVVAAERPVFVWPGQTTRVTFELRNLAHGTHTVRLGTLTGSVTVGR